MFERASFPDAQLNGSQLDLFVLYKEVVTRGGFRAGNGINWKGQVGVTLGVPYLKWQPVGG